jgi:lipopolysaccharide export system protein LptC
MAVPDNTYSRVVFWAKLVLPLLAVVFLATLFLFARTIDPAQNLPFTEGVDVEALSREQRIGAPTFTGVTEGGAAFRLSAARARPDLTRPGRVTGEELRAAIDLPDGETVDVAAATAVLENDARRAELAGGVQVDSGTGYRLLAEDLTMEMEDMRLSTPNPVELTGPGLQLTAGAFDMTGDGTEADPHVLVFKDKVKLIYSFPE